MTSKTFERSLCDVSFHFRLCIIMHAMENLSRAWFEYRGPRSATARGRERLAARATVAVAEECVALLRPSRETSKTSPGF